MRLISRINPKIILKTLFLLPNGAKDTLWEMEREFYEKLCIK